MDNAGSAGCRLSMRGHAGGAVHSCRLAWNPPHTPQAKRRPAWQARLKHRTLYSTPAHPHLSTIPPPSLRRPGEGPEWQARLRQRVLDSVAACHGSITVHTGSWKHDLDQAKCLPSQAGLKVQVRC